MTANRWYAPFTMLQVDKLIQHQQGATRMHPYTCGNNSAHSLLVPTTSEWGWLCPDCTYRQQWAHAVVEPAAPTGDGWIQTFTGRRFYPLAPSAGEVDPLDIAHALSMLCRYGGHSHRFYSVAEHCVLMAQVVSPEHAAWALLHDAAEAYLVDVPRPIKRQLPGYRTLEKNLLGVIAQRFALPVRDSHTLFPPEVSDADTRILLTERSVLMPNTVHEWEVDHLEPLPVSIHGWQPSQAKKAFLTALDELALT